MVHSQRPVSGNGFRCRHRNLEFFGLQFEVGRLAPKPSLGPAVAPVMERTLLGLLSA